MSNIPDDYDPKNFGFSPLEIIVKRDNFEGAARKFKLLVQQEGIINLWREKQSYEKPSVMKNRKKRQAIVERRIQEAKQKLIDSGEWEKRQQKKEEKKQAKLNQKLKEINNDNQSY